jgi:branched-chain amino acid transport system permease protein
MMKKTLIGIIIGFTLLLILFPHFTPRYMTAFLLLLLMHIVIAESYDIVGGYLGYINMGHSAFFGLGAYTFAILLNAKFGFFLSSLMAVLIGVLFAGLISFPFFRLQGAYFSLATFGLIRLVELLAFNLKSLTGGSSGIMITAEYRLTLAYYFTLGLCVLTVGIIFLMTRSKLGLAWTAIREDEEAARSFGIPTFKYKCIALMISASFASLMGAFYTWYIIFINPKVVFGLEIALVPISMAMLGGSGVIIGPIVGAFFITVVEELLWTKVPYFHLAAYGIAIVLVGLFMPGGIVRLKWFRRPLMKLGLLED